MSQTDSEQTSFVASHPKILGALFMTLVLLSQAGSAAAAGGATFAGL